MTAENKQPLQVDLTQRATTAILWHTPTPAAQLSLLWTSVCTLVLSLQSQCTASPELQAKAHHRHSSCKSSVRVTSHARAYQLYPMYQR